MTSFVAWVGTGKGQIIIKGAPIISRGRCNALGHEDHSTAKIWVWPLLR
jgi:hypothetical protein